MVLGLMGMRMAERRVAVLWCGEGRWGLGGAVWCGGGDEEEKDGEKGLKVGMKKMGCGFFFNF